jgi:hypothetical protein
MTKFGQSVRRTNSRDTIHHEENAEIVDHGNGNHDQNRGRSYSLIEV